MDSNLERLWSILAKKDTKPEDGKDVISVNETVSKAATVYEKLRNTLEYEDDHLLRRNAIRRFLRRQAGEEKDNKKIATGLIQELIWARYLPNNAVPESRTIDVEAILNKYGELFLQADGSSRKEELSAWIMDLMSTEVEYALSDPSKEEALISYAYGVFKKHLVWETKIVEERDRDVQLYIAVFRSIAKANISTLRFKVFSLYYPDWTTKPTPELVHEIANNLALIYDTVQGQILHPAQERVMRFVRKYSILFWTIEDMIKDDPKTFVNVLSDPDMFKRKIRKVVENRYRKFHTRLRKTIIRAVGFLLLTKTILALVIELPYEYFILDDSKYAPLIVNIFFHPILLAVVGFTIRIPERPNNDLIQKNLEAMVLGKGELNIRFKIRKPWSKGFLGRVIDLVYFASFVFSYGLIAFVLHGLNFNLLSIIFFEFFLSLVAFLGLKIRSTKQDLVLYKTKAGFIGSVIDVFFLPIIRAGRWIALHAPRVNIILFFFDFIIEAPFKAGIEVIEGWLAYVREKKEEV
ncbi:MAG: hypothetical protein ACD_76C00119G0003 [uncultured bacterium]|nr:MAG: hypothetical protein ACD_76C00119G0003 [uncultured bacterium]HBD04843.1 hypothetical protein [Candidatus Uhrbacteria bacterium]